MESLFLFSNSPFTHTLKEHLCGTLDGASCVQSGTLQRPPGAGQAGKEREAIAWGEERSRVGVGDRVATTTKRDPGQRQCTGQS